METVLEKFEKWKDFLADKIDQAKSTGLSNDNITNLAVQIGNYLEQHVEPKNEEERLLKELWDVGNEEERKAIANLMIKLVQKG